MSKVGVIGGGRMGETLAHLNGLVGLETVLKVKPDPYHLARAREALLASHRREVRRGRQTQAGAEAALARVQITGDYADLIGCKIVIEAIHEDPEAKRRVLAEAEAVLTPDAVLTSSTSSIPATMLAEGLRRPGRLLVTHYIWPAHRRALVELSVSEFAEPDAVERVRALLARQRKTILVVRDCPGFVTTRALLAYLSESVYLVRDGAAPEAVDRALEAFGWPMGPCRLMDTLGLRNAGGLHAFLRHYLGERIGGLALLQVDVEAGFLGHSTGLGFYVHDPGGWVANQAMVELIRAHGPTVPSDKEIVDRAVGLMVNEVAHAIAEGVVPDWQTAALAIDGAFDFPLRHGGLMGYVRGLAPAVLQTRLAELARRFGPRFSAPDLGMLPFER